MTKDEFKALAKGMRAIYTNEKFLPDDTSMKIWYSLLQDIPYNVASIAIQKHMLTNKFPPTPADVREQAALVQIGNKPLWSDGWDALVRAIKTFGIYRQDEAMASMDEITRQTVKRLGYKELCLSENISVERANFRLVFDQLVDREYSSSKLPISLKQRIDAERRQIANNESERLPNASSEAR